jgi:hypothetical protein
MPEDMRLDSKTIAVVVLVLCTLVTGSLAYYFYSQNGKLKQNSQAVTQAENLKTIESVGKLMVLPDNEQPTIATVVDPEKLKAQPFFAKASKDDKVLIYTNARKAILYSPTQNKIVDVAPINIGGDATATADTKK